MVERYVHTYICTCAYTFSVEHRHEEGLCFRTPALEFCHPKDILS